MGNNARALASDILAYFGVVGGVAELGHQYHQVVRKGGEGGPIYVGVIALGILCGSVLHLSGNINDYFADDPNWGNDIGSPAVTPDEVGRARVDLIPSLYNRVGGKGLPVQ